MNNPSDFERWMVSMDGQQPRWWIENATQRDLQEIMQGLVQGWRHLEDSEMKLKSLVGRRLFECVRAWVALPECAICGKTVTLGMIHEGQARLKQTAEHGAASPAGESS